mmetsp:Transcript_29141/g.80001  ORF Transcript_29141/g.80001 Transcript_29141/m.80001 type:complete len:90 (-) Transcript_29141:530-799(-)
MRMRACCDVEGGQLVPRMLDHLVHGCAAYLDRTFPHLMPVLFGNGGNAEQMVDQAFLAIVRHSASNHDEGNSNNNNNNNNATNRIAFSQ